MPIAEGAWVRVGRLWPGVWRVSRILSGFNEIQWEPGAAEVPSTRTVLFLARIVNDKWKRSFAVQTCEISYASLLSNDEIEELETIVASDVGLLDSFNKYLATPHPLHLVANIALGGMSDELVAQFPSICDQRLGAHIAGGLTIPEVLQALAKRDLLQYKGMNPIRATLQLTSENHELRLHDFVFRSYRTMCK
jgi:hypothetical protein